MTFGRPSSSSRRCSSPAASRRPRPPRARSSRSCAASTAMTTSRSPRSWCAWDRSFRARAGRATPSRCSRRPRASVARPRARFGGLPHRGQRARRAVPDARRPGRRRALLPRGRAPGRAQLEAHRAGPVHHAVQPGAGAHGPGQARRGRIPHARRVAGAPVAHGPSHERTLEAHLQLGEVLSARCDARGAREQLDVLTAHRPLKEPLVNLRYDRLAAQVAALEGRMGEAIELAQVAEATALEVYGSTDNFRLWLVKLDRAELLARAGGAENLAASRELAGEVIEHIEPEVAP